MQARYESGEGRKSEAAAEQGTGTFPCLGSRDRASLCVGEMARRRGGWARVLLRIACCFEIKEHTATHTQTRTHAYNTNESHSDHHKLVALVIIQTDC